MNPYDGQALAFRAGVIGFLTQDAVATAVSSIAPSAHGFVTDLPALPPTMIENVLNELVREHEWISERWLRRPDGTVTRVPHEQFIVSDPRQRLASNDCLYEIPAVDRHVHAFLSAVRSDEVRIYLSSAYGEPVRFQSSDVARLRHGQYLRRHSDDHQARRFGLVFYFSPGWRNGYGGELVVEAANGECVAIAPIQGRTTLLRISDEYSHSVCTILSPGWVRHSIAVHYAAAG